jgi:hypothetical protein
VKQTQRSILLVLILFTLLESAGLACTCLPSSVQDGLRQADVVFRGTIKSVSFLEPNDPGSRVVVEFEVSRVWKGNLKSRFKMHSVVETSFCEGFYRNWLVKGKELVVYAFRGSPWLSGRGYTTNICTRTGPVADRKEDLEQLGEGRLPKPTE